MARRRFFCLQPLMATFFAIRDGIRDAKAGKRAYGYAPITDEEHRRDMLHEQESKCIEW